MIIKDEGVNRIKNNMIPLPDGSGVEGTVYRFNNLAVKIFKRPVFKHIEDGFDALHKIKTKSFVLIKDKLYENDTMIGYTMDYINDDFSSMDDVSMKSLISDFKLIKEDLSIFLNNNIYLVDVHRKNIMYNGHIHIIDTDPYLSLSVYKELLDEKEKPEDRRLDIEKNNFKHLNTGMSAFLADRLSNKFTEEEKERFGKGLASKLKSLGEHSVFIGDYVEQEVNKAKCKTLGDYVNYRLKK